MDPDKALARTIELANRLIDTRPLYGPGFSELQDVAQELAETIVGLDEWIRKGGFLPEEWRKEDS